MNAMKTTREKVLTTIKLHPKSTIMEIADQVGINAISVRHHLTNLQAEGLIMAEEERHGVGRPRLVYALTEQGMETFPSRYFKLVNSLIDQLKETLPEKEVSSLFYNMAEKLTADYEPMLAKMSIEERLELLKTILNDEGFEMDWEQEGKTCQIRELSCPYFKIGDYHPEVCVFGKSIISNILHVPLNKISHQEREKDLCTYTVDLSSKE